MAWYDKPERPTGSVPSLGRYFETGEPQAGSATVGRSSEVLLNLLSEYGPIAVPDLATRSGLSLDDLLQSLTGMTDLGLVTVKSRADAIVELTEPGRRVVEQYRRGTRWQYPSRT